MGTKIVFNKTNAISPDTTLDLEYDFGSNLQVRGRESVGTQVNVKDKRRCVWILLLLLVLLLACVITEAIVFFVRPSNRDFKATTATDTLNSSTFTPTISDNVTRKATSTSYTRIKSTTRNPVSQINLSPSPVTEKITLPPSQARTQTTSKRQTTTTTTGCPPFPSNCPGQCGNFDPVTFCPICDYNICGMTPSPVSVITPFKCLSMFCVLNCPNGFMKDPNGCDRCECI